MSTQRRGLGRGLGSLIPSAPPRSDDESAGDRAGPTQPADGIGAYFADVPVASITPNPRQPRSGLRRGRDG